MMEFCWPIMRGDLWKRYVQAHAKWRQWAFRADQLTTHPGEKALLTSDDVSKLLVARKYGIKAPVN
jgi:hypothetical protein